MPRDLTAQMLAELESQLVRPAVFVQIDFDNETIYMWSGAGKISWNGQLWTGMGWLGAISAIPETTDVVAQNITLSLSGIPPQLLGDTINQVRQDSDVTVWFGFLDASGNIIGDPAQNFQGHLDVPSVSDNGQNCTISITAENPLVDLDRAPNRRFTDAGQQLDYPGDLGMSFVTALQNIQFTWPSPNANSSPYLIKLVITPASTNLHKGSTQAFTCTAYYSDSTTANVTASVRWSSGDPTIASITSGGVATGLKEGSVTIIVSSAGLGAVASTALIVTT